jgi:hypothetical protein
MVFLLNETLLRNVSTFGIPGNMWNHAHCMFKCSNADSDLVLLLPRLQLLDFFM